MLKVLNLNVCYLPRINAINGVVCMYFIPLRGGTTERMFAEHPCSEIVVIPNRAYKELLVCISYLFCRGELIYFKLKVIYLKFIQGFYQTLSIYSFV